MRAMLLPAALGLAAPALAEASRPAERRGATPVRIAMSVIDVDEVDAGGQTFVANLYYEARWRDPRLAHDGPGERRAALVDVWHPRLQFLNQQGVVETLPHVVDVHPDGEVAYRQRVWGPFSQALDVEDFPFDEQRFELHLVAAGFDPDEVELRADPERPSELAERLSVADWTIRGVEAEGRSLPIGPEAEPAPAFSVVLEASRRTGYYVLKVILPMLLILAMSWTVFWLDAGQAAVRMGVATTSMLTLIAYRFSIGEDVPRVSYLTRMDLFILVSTLLVFATVVGAAATAYLTNAGHEERAHWLDRSLRVIFPAASLVIFAFAFLL